MVHCHLIISLKERGVLSDSDHHGQIVVAVRWAKNK